MKSKACLICGKRIPLLMDGCGEHWYRVSWPQIIEGLRYLRFWL